MSSEPATRLAKRLKELRLSWWPDVSLTQPQLGEALGVRAPSISSWEKNTPPPASRLYEYATFFATRRSMDESVPRLLRVGELTDQERSVRDELAAELSQLRQLAVGDSESAGSAEAHGHWHFRDDRAVQLICGKLDELDRPKFASAKNLNYIQLAAYADLDSLVELFGHIRACNPSSDVQFDIGTRLESDDLQSHLVVLGSYGAAAELRGPLLERIGVPIQQMPDPDEPRWTKSGKIFVIQGGQHHRPVFDRDDLTEDVALFVRAPHPYNAALTLTIVSGVFTRGVYGAVRMLTDAAVRERNEDYLVKRFAGAEAYAVLMRVPVHDHATASPDLNAPGAVLYEWPVE